MVAPAYPAPTKAVAGALARKAAIPAA